MNAPAMRPARQDRARQKQEKLIAAAAALVAERGFEQVKMTDITARADCAVGTAYYLFGNKEGLFQVLKDRFADISTQRIDAIAEEPALQDAPIPVIAALVVEGTVRGVRENEALLRVALARSAGAPDEWHLFRTLVQRMQKKLTAGLAGRLEEIPHPDPALALGFMLQLVFSTLANTMLNDPGPLSLHDRALEDELTRMACAYLGVTPAQETMAQK